MKPRRIPSYLFLSRNNIYYFRCRIPLDIKLQYNVCKNEIRKSLHTSNYSEAITKARKLWVAMSENDYQNDTRIKNEALWTGRRLLDRLKELESSPNHLPEDTQDFHQRLSEYEKECLKIAMSDDPFSYEHEIEKQDEMIRAGRNIYEQYQGIQNNPEETSRFISSLSEHQLKCLNLIDSNIKTRNAFSGNQVHHNSNLSDSTHYDELKNGINFIKNRITDDGLIAITIDEAINEYYKFYIQNKEENLKQIVPIKTRNEKYNALMVFNLLLGRSNILKTITPHDIEKEYVDKVKRIPARLNTIYKQYSSVKTAHEILEIHFNEVLEIGITKDRPSKEHDTLNKEFTTIKMFLKWAGDRKFVEKGLDKFIPSMSSNKDDDKKAEPFSDNDYKLLFNSKYYLQGKFKKPSEYWIPLIALLTGCRGNEIAFLLKEDIKRQQETNIWYIDITENAELSRTLKAPSSRRSIPIHPELKNLGFLQFVESRKDGSMLFSELKEAEDGNYYKNFGNWFNRLEIETKNGVPITNKNGSIRYRKGYMVRCGVDKNVTDTHGTRSKSFHSLRHYVVNYLDKIGINPRTKNFIVGHQYKNESVPNYIHPDKDDLINANKAIKKLTYPTIDFSLIRKVRW